MAGGDKAPRQSRTRTDREQANRQALPASRPWSYHRGAGFEHPVLFLSQLGASLGAPFWFGPLRTFRLGARLSGHDPLPSPDTREAVGAQGRHDPRRRDLGRRASSSAVSGASLLACRRCGSWRCAYRARPAARPDQLLSAERVGFEPTTLCHVNRVLRWGNRRLKPLSHLSRVGTPSETRTGASGQK
jgi:hypothetical protein